MKLLLPSLLLLLGAQSIKGTDPVTAATLVDTVVKSGESLTNVIEKVEKIFIDPMVRALESKIKKINLAIEGITSQERIEKQKSLELVIDSRKEVGLITISLKSLSRETITRTKSLKTLINALSEDGIPTSDDLEILEYAGEKMIDLIKQSKKIIEEAMKRYETISSKLTKSNVSLFGLEERLLTLKKDVGEDSEWVQEQRAIAYGACAGITVITLGAGAGPCFSVAAIAVESKIAEYKKTVDDAVKVIENSLENLRPVIDQVGNLDTDIKSEQVILGRWEGVLSTMSLDFKNIKNLQRVIKFDRDGVLKMLNNLSNVCQDYLNKHGD